MAKSIIVHMYVCMHVAKILYFRLITWFSLNNNSISEFHEIYVGVPELSIVTMYSVPQQATRRANQQFSFPMQGVQSAFQPLQLGHTPLAAAAAHQSQQSPATPTPTQPIQSPAGAHSQYSTGPGDCYGSGASVQSAGVRSQSGRGRSRDRDRSESTAQCLISNTPAESKPTNGTSGDN